MNPISHNSSLKVRRPQQSEKGCVAGRVWALYLQ